MTKALQRMRDDAGLSTTEYAVGTVAVAGLGGLLLKILTSDWAMDLIKQVIECAMPHRLLSPERTVTNATFPAPAYHRPPTATAP